MKNAAITLRHVCEILGIAAPEGSTDAAFSRLASPSDATPDAIVFAQDAASLQSALSSPAGLILAPLGLEAAAEPRILRVRNPKHAFALCARWFDGLAPTGIHPAALIDPGATIGPEATIAPGCVIHAGATVGSHCKLDANVTVYGCVTLGDNVTVQAGAVVGAMGFGYVRGEDGAYVRFPQQGTLVIEDDVEIGANTTIDRGALGETRIGRGTKIDNQVHIGHNCRIGSNVIIAAQVGISGSCVVGDGVVMAGQVGLGDHVTIGPGVIFGGASGVFPGKHLQGPGQVFMGVPAEPLKDYLKSIAKLRRLK